MGFATVDSIAQYTAKIKNAIFYCRIFLFLSILYIPHYSNNKTILQRHLRLRNMNFIRDFNLCLSLKKTQTDDMLIPFIQM